MAPTAHRLALPIAILLSAFPAWAAESPDAPAGLRPSAPAESAMKAVSPERVRHDIDTLAAFGTRHTLSDTISPTRGIGAARNWLQSQFAAVPGVKVEMESFEQAPVERMPKGGTIVNVIATIPGSGSPQAASRRIYALGHYDSMPTDKMDPTSDAPGANDDASGVVVLLEAARVLAAAHLDSTIVLVATAGEEQGLLGAKHRALAAAEAHENIPAVLNFDIVGDPSPAFNGKPGPHDKIVRVYSEGLPSNPRSMQIAEIRRIASESDSPSRQLARYIRDVAIAQSTPVQPMLIFRPDRFMRGGDHMSFNDAGFAAVRFTTPGEDYTRQHQNVREDNGVKYGDRPQNVDAAYLANVARLNAAALVHLASAPAQPEHVRIVTAKLETSTTLRWEKSDGATGYEVLWRETTSPYWDHAFDAGDATEAHTDVSKDNVYFAVRAYNKAGYRSLPVFAGAAAE